MKNHLILVTGASGKTGKAVMDAFLKKGYSVKAFIHSTPPASSFDDRINIVCGDMNSSRDLSSAMEGVTAIYHICPNMHPDEVSIGRRAIQAAKENGVSHFVYHSVLHPQIKEMPHHWKKMQVEGLLFKSDINFTILQPIAYMQNLLQYKHGVLDQNRYAVPYNGKTRVGMVDLREIAEVAASVITNRDHFGSTYELAPNENFDQFELTDKFSRICHRKVNFCEIDRNQWRQEMEKAGLTTYAITSLVSMFEYYEAFGFTGNGMVLKMLLGRNPNSLDSFMTEIFSD